MNNNHYCLARVYDSLHLLAAAAAAHKEHLENSNSNQDNHMQD